LAALIRIGKVPVDDGVPDSVADPLPLSTKVTPDGRDPDSVSAGTGLPVAVTVNVLGTPGMKVVAAALVIDGACVFVMLKLIVGWVTAVEAAVADT
jgi:hypothetical protein